MKVEKAEVVGGATTFVTMAYILFANPTILGAAGLPADQVLTASALVAGLATIAMGLYARYPFALAPGMGLNAVVAFHLVGTKGLTPPEAMGVVVVEGLVITALVLAGLRERVLDAIPSSLKRAIGAGIGLFLALLGLTAGGLVARAPAPGPALVLGDATAPRTLIFVFGLLIALALVARKVRGGLLIAIAATTILAIATGHASAPSTIVATPDFGLLGDVSFGFFAKLGTLGALLAIFSLMLSDFFDTVGTAVGLGGEAGFLDSHGRLPRMNRVLLVDSLAAVAGGAASCSSATTYIESAAGIADGARTGVASVVTGALFLLAMFFAPLAGVVPPEATASALVVVGFLMCGVLRDVDWKDPTEGAPAFLAAIGMPFTGSISDGIGLGAIAYVVLKVVAGRVREVRPLMWVVAAAFATFFAVG
jgi:adenine/guanine/hypoxanthine permease